MAAAAAAAAASTTLPRNGCLSATQTAALSSSRVTRNHGLLASLRSSRSLHSQFQSRRPATTFRKQLITKTSRSSTVRCSFHESQMGQPDAISDFEKSISDAELQGMVDESLVWSSLNGLVVGDQTVEDSGSVPGSGLIPAPVTLLPTPFPAHHFHRAMELAPLFNALVDAVSQDSDFLQSTLTSAGRSDSFTAGLLRIHAEIIKEGIQQPIRLGMHRSDYMLDTVTGGVLQVELNTISSSFPGLTSRVTDLHRHMVGMYGEKVGLSVDSVPLNTAATDMADALAAAWREYGDESSLILMVVQKPERNMYDQHCLSQLVWQRHGIRVLRRSLKEVQQQGAITGTGELTVDGHRISVVYYRAGYGPGDYPTDLEWQARLLLERSAAVKCPTIAYHLAGAKKVQQQLAQPGVLERFVSDESSLQAMRQCFAGLWSLEEEGGAVEGGGDDGAARNAIIAKAIREPSEFVLKPQREGGGNNIYDEEITRKLTELTEAGEAGRQELAAFILMQRLFPPMHRSVLIRRCQHSWNDTLSELGVYGTYLRNGDKVVINAAAGHLLRTKTATSNEGGVASGFAVLDSPYLV